MKSLLIYPLCETPAGHFAARMLHKAGLSMINHPAPEITHLLLDIPSFAPDGRLRGGGDVETVLERLPENTVVIGGNLNHPALAGHRTVDLLLDEIFLAGNAAITADCVLQIAHPLLKTTFRDTSTLILGWGRIGKCLAATLKALDVPVTVAARKESDRAMLKALGYGAAEYHSLPNCALVINTVPGQHFLLHSPCVKIDLASQKSLSGEDVVWSRGLPGIYAPESSGTLITETILRLCKEEIP